MRLFGLAHHQGGILFHTLSTFDYDIPEDAVYTLCLPPPSKISRYSSAMRIRFEFNFFEFHFQFHLT